MDIDIKIFFATIGVVALAIGIFAAIRNKSIGFGLIAFIFLFLFFAITVIPVIGALGGVFWLIYAYRHYVSVLTQIRIDFLISMISMLTMWGVFLVWGRRSKKAGNLVVNGQTKNAYLAQGAGMLLYIYNFLAKMNDNFSPSIVTTPQPYSGGNNFLWIVLICFALYWCYSTEWREKGFVYRGKVIPFTDVVHAQWESQWTKTKLKIKLANSEQELAFVISPEMAPAIDNYLRFNFPAS